MAVLMDKQASGFIGMWQLVVFLMMAEFLYFLGQVWDIVLITASLILLVYASIGIWLVTRKR